MVHTSLRDLYENHGGKVSDKWNSYIEFYDEVFSPFRSDPVRILEIGVQNGGSLEIWAKYFPNAVHILGCDIAPEAAALTFDDPRISVVVGDANDPKTVAAIAAIVDQFDIIIDDGSHRSDDIIKSFALYFPKLREGGIFLVEDLHCAYWDEFQGGLEAPFSSMNFFKRLADLVNHEHWGADLTSDKVLGFYAAQYGAEFAPAALDLISELRFRNSLCMITKGAQGGNLLGRREVVGQESIVWPVRPDEINGHELTPPPQDKNTYGPNSLRIEAAASSFPGVSHDLALIRDREEALQAEILRKTASIARAEARIATLNATIGQLSQSMVMAQRRPHHLLAKLMQYRVLRALSKSKHLPEDMTQRFARSAKKRDPRRLGAVLDELGHSGIDLSSAATPSSERVHQSPLRRLAFHRSGKPRGWLRTLAFPPGDGTVRPIFARAFYKKNGSLRPDFRAFLAHNPQYFRQKLPIPEFQLPVAAVVLHDVEDIPRQIFAQQQAELTAVDAADLIATFDHKPLISIIMPVYKTPVEWLQRAVESLQDQFYENWELCVVDDCSPGPEQRRLLEDMARTDPRIRLAVMPKNGGISAASNLSLEMAKGEFFALVDHDDEITPDALLRMVEAINADPQADFLYSDECKIDDTPARRLFHFLLKPDWSPEILLNFMVTGHLTVYRTELVRKIGGFRTDFDFSQDYDLALRMAEAARSIVHVERILYLWRAINGSAASGGKDFARASNVAALGAALERRQIPGTAETLPHANYVHIPIPKKGSRVAIVIPSDSAKNLRLALDAIREGTDYDNYEVRVVCNSRVAAELEGEYRSWPPAKFVRYDKPYNFSDKCNEGARAAEADIVIFYNDDVFPIGRDWIEQLIQFLWVPGVGATSPQLLYKDGTIQYAGMISGTPGLAGTAYHRLPHNHTDAFLSMNKLVRNISVLSGACCAMRRELFLKVGGFDAVNTPDGHSDLDLSYKILDEGLRCVYTPYALLTHIGNHSWGAKATKYKADIYCLKRWGGYLSRDMTFTPSMIKTLYNDFTFDYQIFAQTVDPQAVYTGPDVLFVSHELTETGAPHMLLEAARAVKAAGGFPVIMAPSDGPLRQIIQQDGIAVIIDASLLANHFLFERFATNFDVVVVNTIAMRPVVEQLQARPNLPIYWWLHESQSLTANLQDLPINDWPNVELICVSDYAKGYLPPNLNCHILINGLPDHSGSIKPATQLAEPGKLVFLVVGTIEPRKGQDVFAAAILALPEQIRQGCKFAMVGKLWPRDEAFWQQIERDLSGHPEVSYLGDVSHARALSLIAACDVLVSCSRDDAFPLVTIEAAQLRKPQILSDHVGTRHVLDDSCAFAFASEDVADLRDCMIRAFENREQLPAMGEAARHIYEQRLTDTAFARNFMALISGASQ